MQKVENEIRKHISVNIFNLRNTRYVHIMEPYWHPARMEQVIGRARRICSHTELPEQFQTVEVFVYLMTFSPDQLDSEASIELKLKDDGTYSVSTITHYDGTVFFKHTKFYDVLRNSSDL